MAFSPRVREVPGSRGPAFSLLPDSTIAMVGIGAWKKGSSSNYDAIDQRGRDAISAAGAHAEIAGVSSTRTGAA
jgi:hypothetical protein